MCSADHGSIARGWPNITTEAQVASDTSNGASAERQRRYRCSARRRDDIRLKRGNRTAVSPTSDRNSHAQTRPCAICPHHRHPRPPPARGTRRLRKFRLRATVALVTWAAALIVGAALFKPLSAQGQRHPVVDTRNAEDVDAVLDAPAGDDRGGRGGQAR